VVLVTLFRVAQTKFGRQRTHFLDDGPDCLNVFFFLITNGCKVVTPSNFGYTLPHKEYYPIILNLSYKWLLLPTYFPHLDFKLVHAKLIRSTVSTWFVVFFALL
jgi:hypothetical protein